MSCPMCQGTDAERDCTAGQCRFQAEIEAEAAIRNAELEEERRVNEELAPEWPLTLADVGMGSDDFL